MGSLRAQGVVSNGADMADQPGCCSAESKFELVCCPVAEEPDAATSVAQQCSCLCVPVGAVVALMTHGQADLGPHIHDEFIDTLSDEEYTSLRFDRFSLSIPSAICVLDALLFGAVSYGEYMIFG